MVFIDGVKYACETCIRGHRVTTCVHKDRPLTMIKPKGRPVSQCPHCREARKNHALHTKCDCPDGKAPVVQQEHASNCACAHGGKCDCSKLKNAGRAAASAANKKLKVGSKNSSIAVPVYHGQSPYRVSVPSESPSPVSSVHSIQSLNSIPQVSHMTNVQQHKSQYGDPPVSMQLYDAYSLPKESQIREDMHEYYNNKLSLNSDTTGRNSASSISTTMSCANAGGYDSESAYSSFDEVPYQKELFYSVPPHNSYTPMSTQAQQSVTGFLDDFELGAYEFSNPSASFGLGEPIQYYANPAEHTFPSPPGSNTQSSLVDCSTRLAMTPASMLPPSVPDFCSLSPNLNSDSDPAHYKQSVPTSKY
ncbi:copper fist DNA binding domain-containing protein [Lipomyces arxii]|uniref:copper fist DNA binding domain-containing protein n=1 Tax=Lipomyces arxii TaxID=56418 RepID=UPI0034CDE520